MKTASEMVADGGDLAVAALAYARLGRHVFPLAPHDKIPLIAKKFGGRGCLDATTDAAKIRRWWQINPRANIGIATGQTSGFFVVDVDPHKGGDESLADLERRNGPLPHTVISITGGGGRHILFKHVPGIGNSAERRLGAGLDLRGQGGYIAAPPSIHESGRAYAWDVDHHPDDTPVADAPRWLIDLARGPVTSAGHAVAELPENWRKLVAYGVGEGKRNEAVARLAGHLLRRGIDPLVTLDLVRCWNASRCRPPLDDAEVIKTVDSIAGRELQRRGAA